MPHLSGAIRFRSGSPPLIGTAVRPENNALTTIAPRHWKQRARPAPHNLIPARVAISYHCCAPGLTTMLIAPSFRKPILRRNMGMPRRTTRESA